jgi:putative PIN family toxin of toxin-antitoxin system
VRIVLDTTILVRANEGSHGLARQLLLDIVTSRQTLLVSNEILYELARVLRYPRMQALHRLPEARIYDYIGSLREVSQLVTLSPLLSVPIRDVNDIVVVQTAVIGQADVICTKDQDFYEAGITRFLASAGISVMDDVALIEKIRAGV